MSKQSSNLDSIVDAIVDGSYQPPTPTSGLQNDPGQPAVEMPTRERYVPPGGQYLDESTGAPVVDRLASGLSRKQEGRVNYFEKKYGAGNVWVDYEAPEESRLRIQMWVPVSGKTAEMLKENDVPLRTGEDGPEAFRWVMVNAKGLDLGDVAENAPGVTQALANIGTGFVTRNPYTTGAVAGSLEAARKAAAIAMGSDDQQTPVDAAKDIAREAVEGTLMQGGANVLARGMQQANPIKTVGRMIRNEASEAGQGLGPSPQKSAAYTIEDGRVRGIPDSAPPRPSLSSQLGSAARGTWRGMRGAHDAFMGKQGTSSLLNEGEEWGNLGPEAARRMGYIDKYGTHSATISQRTGSQLAEGLEDVARAKPASAQHMKTQSNRLHQEYYDSFNKVINAKSTDEIARPINIARVKRRRLVRVRQAEFDNDSKARFDEMYRTAGDAPIFSYGKTKKRVDKLLAEMKNAASQPNVELKAYLERLKATLSGESRPWVPEEFPVKQRSLREETAATGSLRDMQNRLGEVGPMVDKPELMTGSDIVPPKAKEYAKRIYSALLDDMADATPRHPELVPRLQETRQWYKQQLASIERMKKDDFSRMMGVFEKRRKPGQSVNKALLNSADSEIRSVLRAAKEIDADNAREIQAGLVSEYFRSAESVSKENVPFRSFQKTATLAAKGDAKLKAIFWDDPKALKEIQEIGELARILVETPVNSRTFARLSFEELTSIAGDMGHLDFKSAAKDITELFMDRRIARLLTDPDLRKTLLKVSRFPKKKSAFFRTVGETTRSDLIGHIKSVLDEQDRLDEQREGAE